MKDDKNNAAGVDEIIELVGDKGDVLKFTHIGTIDYKDEKYVFFQPAEEDADEAVVFKMGKDGEEDVLLPIEDENLLNEVFTKFVEIYDDEED